MKTTTTTLVALTLLTLAAATTATAQSNWFTVGTSGSETFQIKNGSLQYAEHEGQAFYGVVGQVRNSATNDVNYYFWAVDDQDCAAELGTLSIGTMQGDHISDVSFVFDGASVASTIAQVICVAATEG